MASPQAPTLTKEMLAGLADELTPEMILDSISDGLYVTDTNRRIIYWGKAAERILGWTADEVIGRDCHDGMLCHIDKDGHSLCGQMYCPLFRSMLTGQRSNSPLVMFAQAKNGERIPLQVAVSPLRNAAGEVMGGVETFRDLSAEIADIERVREIQLLALKHDLPDDPRIRFAAHYVPHDIIGGDYYAIARLDDDRYGLLLADVAGHGVPAALYTMFLSSLWASQRHLLLRPVQFAQAVNEKLHSLIKEEEPFATASCALIDLKHEELRLVGAGNPPPLVVRPHGPWEHPHAVGIPLGVFKGTRYEEMVVPLRRGDCVLFYTDGAIEITDPDGTCLGLAGLVQSLQRTGYPGSAPNFQAVETDLLTASNRIRFDDDLTFVDVRVM